MVGGRPAPVSLPTTRSGGGSELCLMRTTMCILTKTKVHLNSHNQVHLNLSANQSSIIHTKHGSSCPHLSQGMYIPKPHSSMMTEYQSCNLTKYFQHCGDTKQKCADVWSADSSGSSFLEGKHLHQVLADKSDQRGKRGTSQRQVREHGDTHTTGVPEGPGGKLCHPDHNRLGLQVCPLCSEEEVGGPTEILSGRISSRSLVLGGGGGGLLDQPADGGVHRRVQRHPRRHPGQHSPGPTLHRPLQVSDQTDVSFVHIHSPNNGRPRPWAAPPSEMILISNLCFRSVLGWSATNNSIRIFYHQVRYRLVVAIFGTVPSQ